MRQMRVLVSSLGAVLLASACATTSGTGSARYSAASPSPAPVWRATAAMQDSLYAQSIADREGPNATIRASFANVAGSRRVQGTFRVDDDAYVLVGHIDAEGTLRVIFPLNPGDDGLVRGSKTYQTTLATGGEEHSQPTGDVLLDYDIPARHGHQRADHGVGHGYVHEHGGRGQQTERQRRGHRQAGSIGRHAGSRQGNRPGRGSLLAEWAREKGFDLEGSTFIIQGFGNVGSHAGVLLRNGRVAHRRRRSHGLSRQPRGLQSAQAPGPRPGERLVAGFRTASPSRATSSSPPRPTFSSPRRWRTKSARARPRRSA